MQCNQVWCVTVTGNTAQLKESCLCSLPYLLAVAHTSTVHGLLHLFKSVSNSLLDRDIIIVTRCLVDSLEILERSVLLLVSELWLYLVNIVGRWRSIVLIGSIGCFLFVHWENLSYVAAMRLFRRKIFCVGRPI